MNIEKRKAMRSAIVGAAVQAEDNYANASEIEVKFTKKRGMELLGVLDEAGEPAKLTGTVDGLLANLAVVTDPAFVARAISECEPQMAGYTYRIPVAEEAFDWSFFDQDEFVYVAVKPLRDASAGLAEAGFAEYSLDRVDMFWVIDFADRPDDRLFLGVTDRSYGIVGSIPFIYRQVRKETHEPGFEHVLTDFAEDIPRTRQAVADAVRDVGNGITDVQGTADAIWEYFVLRTGVDEDGNRVF